MTTVLRAVSPWLTAILLVVLPSLGFAEPQDPPDFKGKHELPPVGYEDNPARSWEMGIVDIFMLFFALSLATWFIHKSRSRKGLFWLGLFSLGYFGFYREGCVCSIGSIQDVTYGWFHGVPVALVIIVYFFLPLIFSALFGRSYCAAVCPQGAIQDLVVVKPIEVPRWLEQVLGFLPFVYLGLGVFFAATAGIKVICDYDPFIALFRMTGSPSMLGLGILFLVVGMFIGRPYCRYMCPYGVLLRIFSYVSRWEVKIYPDRCIDCALCDDSCPFGAIDKTTPLNQSIHPKEGKQRLVIGLLMLPVLIGGLGWLFASLTGPVSMSHEKVRVAHRMEQELMVKDTIKKQDDIVAWSQTDQFAALIDKGLLAITSFDGTVTSERDVALLMSEETETLFDDGAVPAEVFATGAAAKESMRLGLWWVGGFLGLILGWKFIALCLRRRRIEYEANRGSCYSCGRCYDYCPGSNGVPVQFETGGHIRTGGAS